MTKVGKLAPGKGLGRAGIELQCTGKLSVGCILSHADGIVESILLPKLPSLPLPLLDPTSVSPMHPVDTGRRQSC